VGVFGFLCSLGGVVSGFLVFVWFLGGKGVGGGRDKEAGREGEGGF
jgi:hypothetical protein